MEHFPEEQEEIEIEAIGVEVSSQPVELYKVLKLANVVDGGGQAKHFIAEGYVAVNGELENRKRRKMYDGDFLEFNQEYYVVVCDQPPVEIEEQKPVQVEHSKPKKKTNKKKSSNASGKSKESKPTNKRSKADKPKSEPASETKVERKPGDRGTISFF
ncbi:RNA-binding S4 domain-containing protein [Vibrio sp. FNV 38]|nr:RNA-binding S4 domain-containing protein [Vibrio sp. FNV 38]